MHLFDVDIPGEITFRESDVFSPGNELTSFQFGDVCRIGVGICYDIRFAEMAQLYTRNYGTKHNRIPARYYSFRTLSDNEKKLLLVTHQ